MARPLALDGAGLVCQAYFNAALSRILARPVESTVTFHNESAGILVKVGDSELFMAVPPGMSISETMEIMVAPLAGIIVAGVPPTDSLSTGSEEAGA